MRSTSSAMPPPRTICAATSSGGSLTGGIDPVMSSTAARLKAVNAAALDPQIVKRDFPVFENNPGLVFLDTAASAQKPRSVIDGVAVFYRRDYANVHRGVY